MTHFPKPVSPTRQRFLLCAGAAGKEEREKGCSSRGRSKVRKVRRGQRWDHWTKGSCRVSSPSLTPGLSWDKQFVPRRLNYLSSAICIQFSPLSARPRVLGHKSIFCLALLCFCMWSLPGPLLAGSSVHRLSISYSPQIQTQILLNHCPHLLLQYRSLSPLNLLNCCLYRETSTDITSSRLKDHELNTLQPPKCGICATG